MNATLERLPEGLGFRMDLNEYFAIYAQLGKVSILISPERVNEIKASCPDWEKHLYFESLGAETTTVRMYRLKDWEWKRRINTENKEVVRQEVMKEKREEHTQFEAWKKEARVKLQNAGLNSTKVEQYMQMAINPTNDTGWRLRAKLGYPEKEN